MVGGDGSSRNDAISGELQSDTDFMAWAQQENATTTDDGKIPMIDLLPKIHVGQYLQPIFLGPCSPPWLNHINC